MARGLPKEYIAKYGVSKKAWREYRKDQTQSKSKSNPKTRTKKVSRTAKKNKKRRRPQFTIPVAPTIGAISAFAIAAPTGRTLIQDAMEMNLNNFLYDAKELFTGIDNNGKLHLDWLVRTYAPATVGMLVHILASKLGINRMLGRARVPLVRI